MFGVCLPCWRLHEYPGIDSRLILSTFSRLWHNPDMDKPATLKTRRVETFRLPDASPGTRRTLDFIHYGVPGPGPRAYLQAALHADEIPGLLVLQQLVYLLNEADRQGLISGQVVVAPIANPVGNSQHLLGELSGRYDQASGTNFNRDYPDLADRIAARVAAQLGDDADANTRLIRAVAREELAKQQPLEQSRVLKLELMKRAIDADIVLDLHCDWQSVMHLYTGTPIWNQARPLAAYLGARATLLAEVSGGHPFDEALSGLWWTLAARFPERPIEPACMAATIELRGKADTEEGQARQDALAIYRYLQYSGVIAGEAPAPPELINDATPLSGVDKIRAPHAGVVSYSREPGDRVHPGEVVCTLFRLDEYDDPDAARTELRANVEGILYARRLDRLARPGQTLCRIAGKEPVVGEPGHLLEN